MGKIYQSNFKRVAEDLGWYVGIAKKSFTCGCCKKVLILKDEYFAFGSTGESEGFCGHCLDWYANTTPEQIEMMVKIIKARNN